MTEQEIIRHIDEGANYYAGLFGKAEHMETIEEEFYTYIKPKAGEYGICFVYNVSIENLAPEQQKEMIAKIKSLNMPVWFSLQATDELYNQFFGKSRVHGQTVFAEDDEIYMALLPEDEIRCDENERIVKVQTAKEFEIWAKIANDVLAGGKPDMHPIYHYPLCSKGLMKCYILYHDNVPTAVAATMNNEGAVSLEFVATIPEMRRRGFASALCARAVQEAFAEGARIVTVRAINAAAGKVYEAIGFQAYNYAL